MPARKPRTLEDEVRRLRAGIVQHPPSARDPREAEMVRVVSAAALAWDGQLDRVDRFSLPLLPSGTSSRERANPAMTAQLFLEQVASDYRRVASCTLDLPEVEARRNSDQGATALRRAGVVSRPVAPLAVGQYLAAHAHGGDADPASVVQPWMSAQDARLESQYAAAFGAVLGPLIQAAQDNSHAHPTITRPGWSGHVGDMWCDEFIAAGAEILKWPALLTGSRIEGRLVVASRQRPSDVTETTNRVVALAEAFRRVADVRVSAAGNLPKIDLVLSGDALRQDEFDQFMASVQKIAADVTILPT